MAELPYRELFDYRDFTIAVSRLSTLKTWPKRDWPPVAHGVVHLEGGVYYDGSHRPLLPTEITFETEEPRYGVEGDNLGSGGVTYYEENGIRHYALQLSIKDPGGEIVQGVKSALHNAVISGNQYFHITCRKGEEKHPCKQVKNWEADYERHKALIARLEAGDESIPSVWFDRVLFSDTLLTRAPVWSWMWEGLEWNLPLFQDKATAKYRRVR